MAHHNYHFTISYVHIPSPVPISPFVTNFVTYTPFVLSIATIESQYVILSTSFTVT